MFKLGLILGLVNIGWLLVFQAAVLNFWWRLIIVASLQLLLAGSYSRLDISWDLADLVWGGLSALGLYFIFWVGNKLSPLLLVDAKEEIATVYQLRQQLELPVISLILLVVGPSEEIFWRGFIQQKLGYWVTAFLYALLHIWTGNLILILAALVAGLFWGWLFLQRDSLLLVIISHTLWDLLIFVFFPVA
ncbi:CPBP family intramembrane glutamic endopeptidase [Halanaerobaculum tunisiense]